MDNVFMNNCVTTGHMQKIVPLLKSIDEYRPTASHLVYSTKSFRKTSI